MKKILIIIALVNTFIVFSQKDTIQMIRARQVSIYLLKNVPLEHCAYAIVSKKEFEELLLSGEERNHGEYNHEARLFNEKEFNYWISHPDDRSKGKYVFEFYFGKNDTIPSKISLKRGQILIFKKGTMEVPLWEDQNKEKRT